MKASEFRQLTDAELEARIRELRQRLFQLRLRHATGQLEQTSLLRATRKDLARALTVRNERRRKAS